MNDTVPTHPALESMNEKVAKAVASGIITFISIFGNILVIMAVWAVPRMKTVTNYLIVNMAMTDLLYVLIAMPPLYIEIFDLQYLATDNYWVALYICKIIHFMQYTLISASVLTLACMAFDRYIAIVFPLKKVFTTTKVFYITVAIIWVIAVGVGAPSLYGWKAVYDQEYGYYCDEQWSKDRDESMKISISYTVVLFLVAYCIPFMSITIMYSIVCRRVWKRKVIKSRHKKQYRKAIESRKKVLKMLITVVIAFVICWLPYQIATIVWHAGIDISNTTDFMCKFLIRMHTGTSPLIYAIFSENYRRGFHKALTCGFSRQMPLSRSLTKFSLHRTLSTRRSSHFKSASRDHTPDDVLNNCETARQLQLIYLLKQCNQDGLNAGCNMKRFSIESCS